jgi:predicted RND superfamily exporter protein
MEKGRAKVLIVILVILIICAGGVLAYKITKDKENIEETVANENTVPVEEKRVQIFNGNDRPIAVMIDNHSDAWPQAGLQDAYMVYEIVVEGGETRLMALFKGANVEKIGPVRSARHYFIDYAMENDAIYVHFGQSPQAESDIKKYSINDINGISEDGTTFWRVKDKVSPHNAVTSTENLLESAKSKKFKTTSSESSILNYVTNEVNLEAGEEAKSVTIPHSTLQTVKYVYNEEEKVYERYARNKQQKDWTSGNAVTTKNIIITFCDNYTLTDSENKGRQGLKNIGTFDGYYITNGRAIKIKCIKNARDDKTIYQDLAGNTIEVNDGNTFVNICPTNSNVVFESSEENS